MNDLPPLLDTRQLAALLGMSEAGARAVLRRGELPSFSIGRRKLVRRETFLAHIRQAEAESVAKTEDDVADVLRVLAPRRRRRRS